MSNGIVGSIAGGVAITRAARATGLLLILLLLAPVAAVSSADLSIRMDRRDPAGLHAVGATLIDAGGHPVRLTGVNWFGFETAAFAPHGLDVRNWQDMLDQIKASGFNTIRLPYSNQLFDPSSLPLGIDYKLNRDLRGLAGVALMDRIIEGAGKRGLMIILDRHRPTAAAQSPLWYTARVPESRWIGDWTMLARHYRGDPAVIGADLHNEPHGLATWGTGNTATDWRLAAERAGNAILAVNPDWLIFVQGVQTYNGRSSWWGGNLEGAGPYPIRLSHSDRLVYSVHDYGPGVYPQSWFKSRDFPRNLEQLWRQNWAYLQLTAVAPMLVGELGGRSVGRDADGTWQRTLVRFLNQNRISYTYWSWTPDSGDTGGILEQDWRTVDQAKLALLGLS